MFSGMSGELQSTIWNVFFRYLRVYRCPAVSFSEAEIPFGAPYQVQNAAVALQALECLAEEAGISQEAIQRGMAKTEWKGRMA